MDTYALTPQTLIALARTWEEHAARLGSAATTLSRRPAGFAPAVHAALDDFSDDWVRLLKCAQRVAEDHGDALRSCLSSDWAPTSRPVTRSAASRRLSTR